MPLHQLLLLQSPISDQTMLAFFTVYVSACKMWMIQSPPMTLCGVNFLYLILVVVCELTLHMSNWSRGAPVCECSFCSLEKDYWLVLQKNG